MINAQTRNIIQLTTQDLSYVYPHSLKKLTVTQLVSS